MKGRPSPVPNQESSGIRYVVHAPTFSSTFQMVRITKFTLVSASIVAVSAVPWDQSSLLSTHRRRDVADGSTVETYHPTNIYKTFGSGVGTPLKKRGEPAGSIEQSAASFIEDELKLDSNGYRIRSSASTQTGGAVWVQQVVNGIPVANAVANVALNTNDDVVAFGANFHGENGARAPASIAPATPAITKESAISFAERKLGGSHNGKVPTLEYYIQSSGDLALTWVVEVQTHNDPHWYEAFVDASNGNVIASNDFVAGSSYLVVDPTKKDVTQGLITAVNPHDGVASPRRWHGVGTNETTTDTSGNNAISYKGNNTAATTKQSASGQVFNYRYDTSVSPTSGQNVDAARVNTFFLSNKIHDINYRYGFTEKTFNFQNDNFSKGGSGNDRIKISVQDSGGINNAFFATPPDGSSGQMWMYIWTMTGPNRDGDLSNDIIAHEQTHGTTNRMTGGGTGRCLQTPEANGMGEGWSDAYAEWLQHKDASVPDFVLGAWVYNNPKGVRAYPYSTNATTNPLRYSNLKALNKSHAIGEVWANMLHNVYAALVKGYGWTADSFTNPDCSSGNVVFLRLFFDALLIQPCNPTMSQARDAWIQADVNRYNGIHKCALWKSFASRGLGVNATNYVDSTTLPSAC